MSDLIRQFRDYSSWREEVAASLLRYQQWLAQAQLANAADSQHFQQLFERLRQDKLTIAFVAEFSRGKSELINAIFFADYGQRVLPSAAGRTTMCPTELLYDETFPPSIRLLPIETRGEAGSTSDFREQGQAWTVLPLDIRSGDGMLDALRQVSLTKRVPVADARRYGLYDDNDNDGAPTPDADGMVEVSQWRHAIINFPHPLLKQGLVIIDTPGLNAIGSEPELTLNLIPNAQAVLFILAADAGVSKSDIQVWRENIGAGPGRMVVLNKIDSMWDELRSPREIEAQIDAQIASVAQTLNLSPELVFPVSAQKGLVGKINHDLGLLYKSRLPALENALSQQLLPQQRRIMGARLQADLQQLLAGPHALLSARARNVVEQLLELGSLRGKNRNIVEHMMKRVDLERQEFDRGLLKLHGTRTVFARLSTEVFTSLGMDILKTNIAQTRQAMDRSHFTLGFRSAVRQFFEQIQTNLVLSAQKTDEIGEMMTVMYRKFSTEHGLALTTPMPFSLSKYQHEIALIEHVYQRQFGAAVLMTTRQVVLMQKFFDSIASRVRHSFLQANRDVEAWLKVVMAPLEAQIREHKQQLKQRMQSIERIHLATDSLEEKIQAFEQMQGALQQQQAALDGWQAELAAAVANGEDTAPSPAASAIVV